MTGGYGRDVVFHRDRCRTGARIAILIFCGNHYRILPNIRTVERADIQRSACQAAALRWRAHNLGRRDACQSIVIQLYGNVLAVQAWCRIVLNGDCCGAGARISVLIFHSKGDYLSTNISTSEGSNVQAQCINSTGIIGFIIYLGGSNGSAAQCIQFYRNILA